MPDLGAAAGSLLEVFGPLVRPLVGIAARALFGSIVGLLVLGSATALGAYELGARAGSWRGLMAVAVTVVFMAILGPVLAVKRAVGKASVHALTQLGLGRSLLGFLFDGIVRIDASGEAGARGSWVQQGVERMPLVEVERRAKAVVARVTGAGQGFLMSRVRRSLLDKVAALTLETLRAEGEQGGGVDLVRARAQLEAAVDQRLAAGIERALFTTTVMLGLALVLGSLGVASLLGR